MMSTLSLIELSNYSFICIFMDSWISVLLNGLYSIANLFYFYGNNSPRLSHRNTFEMTPVPLDMFISFFENVLIF